jgi:hypothetical protein
LRPTRLFKGPLGHIVAPVFDDPIFLEKYTTFIQAFAARYDGDPRLALYDIRSYGTWGECHTGFFSSPGHIVEIRPEKFREHVQIHLDAFKKTQLCLSCNANLGHCSPLKPIMDWAVVEKHISPRRDGICGNSDGSETAIGFGIVPGVFEFYDNYELTKSRGWWEGKKDEDGFGYRLDDSIENGKPTWVDFSRGGRSALNMLHENREMIERLTNRIGYHFHLKRAAFPGRAAAGDVSMELTWTNAGVAPIYIPCAVAVSLFDADGKRVATAWPEQCNPADWYPDKSVVEKASADFGSVPPGNYRLAVAITRKSGDAEPYIKLGTQLPIHNGWYELGSITLSAN